MKKTIITAAALVTILVFAFVSCRKVDSVKNDLPLKSSEFFNTAGADPLVKAISQKIYRQNEKKHFVEKLKKKAGNPLWSKATIVQKPPTTGGKNTDYSTADTIVYIPFSPTDYDYIGAILIVGINQQDTSFQMLYNWEYRKYPYIEHSDTSWVARDIFNLFADFEYAIYGHTEFWISNPQIFGLTSDPDSVVWATREGSGNRGVVETEFCMNYKVCKVKKSTESISPSPLLIARGIDNSTRSNVVAGNCTMHTICTKYYSFTDDDEPGQGGGPAGSPEEGGGQPGGLEDADDYGWYSDPCTNPEGTEITPTTTVCGGPTGWVALQALFTVYDWDISQIPDNDFNNCLKNFLSSKLNKDKMQELINHNMDYIGSDFSDVLPKKFHIKFKVDNTIKDAAGNPIPAKSDEFFLWGTHQEATITINPDYFANASEEYLGLAVLHEMKHIILKAYKTVEAEWQNHQTMFFQRRVSWIVKTAKDLFLPPGSTANVDETDLTAIALDGFIDAWLVPDPNNPGHQMIDPTANTFSQNNYGLPLSEVESKAVKFYNGNTKGTNFCH